MQAKQGSFDNVLWMSEKISNASLLEAVMNQNDISRHNALPVVDMHPDVSLSQATDHAAYKNYTAAAQEYLEATNISPRSFAAWIKLSKELSIQERWVDAAIAAIEAIDTASTLNETRAALVEVGATMYMYASNASFIQTTSLGRL